jgi:NAD(P)-dependent dehydrogenase (short-subunit alcohol dehydrogenase family)
MGNDRKVIVVTGASSGIGNASATLLAKRGHRVFGGCRKPSENPRRADEFFDMVPMDVTQDASVAAAFSTILESAGKVDVLVCCAGSGIAGSVEETSLEEAKAQFETNYFGTLRTIKAVLPHFRVRGSGRIIVLSSIVGRVGFPFQPFYSSSKFALEGLIEALRLELRGFGVEACLVEPGDYRSGFTAARKTAASYLAAGVGSPYHRLHEAVMGQQVHDEEAGRDPLEVARLVEKLITIKRLPLRTTVGPLVQRLAPLVKGFLPARLFESLLAMMYHIGR